MTRLKDLIEIPERVHRGDFVLRLTEGLASEEARRATLDSYVVTDRLAKAFDEALAFLEGAIEARTSKATYLHGSFGSGKSHFMAVLHLLLQHDPNARAVPELASVLARHDAWLQGRKLLLVPFHMIGASSMEAAILGQYVDHVRRLHPGAPMPGVFLGEKLIHDARALRSKMGDEAFFAGLEGEGDEAKSGWAKLSGGGTWSAERFDAAAAAAPGDPERARLVGALVDHYFTGFHSVATGAVQVNDDREIEENFVDLDTGLSLICHHARDLGYDGLVLFLDELVLWLASRVGDMDFVSREGQKISKLVESRVADRPIPLVSIVARQRDLRELVGDNIPGSEKLGFADTLKYWESRFGKIELEDRNLPAIVEKRLLEPKDEAAAAALREAADRALSGRREVVETLLTQDGDRRLFRQVYPFSPALVNVLIALSQVLQRERTAIRVMLQLLVDQRDTLEVDQVIPLGDLWDVIAEEAEPFSDAMRRHFDRAQAIYAQKLRPMLERDHGLEPGEAERLDRDDPRWRAWRDDARLVKTLLLAALVPEVPALDKLTVDRLEALNHGVVRAPIPGREKTEVLQRLRRWVRLGATEIRISDDSPPTVSLWVSSIDTQAIIERARAAVDNAGARSSKVREMVFRQFGPGVIDDRLNHEPRYRYRWRGSERRVDLRFGNVRKMSLDVLEAAGSTPKVVIDYPFDEPKHSPREDHQQLEKFQRQRGETGTIAWLPRFFSESTLSDLGVLVALDHVLASDDRLHQYTDDLSAVDRSAARSQLESQRSQLKEGLREALLGAYDVLQPPAGSLDTSHGELSILVSLDPDYRDPRLKVCTDLGSGLDALLDQWFTRRFPAHPDFGEDKLGKSDLRKVLDVVLRAIEAEGRVAVDKQIVPLMQRVAVPLQLGEQGETHFAIRDDFWRLHFDPVVQAADSQAPTVAALRARLDEPTARGLERPVQDLVLIAWAAMVRRAFVLGGPFDPTLGDLPDEARAREQSLPDEATWKEALTRSHELFGVAGGAFRSPANVGRWSAMLSQYLEDHHATLRGLAEAVEQRATRAGLDGGARLAQARRVAELVDTLRRARRDDLAETLATFDLGQVPLEHLKASVGQAGPVVEALRRTNWQLLGAVAELRDDRAEEGNAITRALREALEHAQFSIDLPSRLRELESRATSLLARSSPAASPAANPAASPQAKSVAPVRMPEGTSSRGERRVADAADLAALRDDLERALEGGAIRVRWHLAERGE